MPVAANGPPYMHSKQESMYWSIRTAR
jgi:hypothetical protein